MTLEILQKARNKALREGNKTRKLVLNEMIDAVQKASITNSGRVEITEDLVNGALLKLQKVYHEMVDTCPKERVVQLAQYKERLQILEEFVPHLVTDEIEINVLVTELAAGAGLTFEKQNRGKLMKLFSTELKGKADMKVVASVVNQKM